MHEEKGGIMVHTLMRRESVGMYMYHVHVSAEYS